MAKSKTTQPVAASEAEQTPEQRLAQRPAQLEQRRQAARQRASLQQACKLVRARCAPGPCRLQAARAVLEAPSPLPEPYTDMEARLRATAQELVQADGDRAAE